MASLLGMVDLVIVGLGMTVLLMLLVTVIARKEKFVISDIQL